MEILPHRYPFLMVDRILAFRRRNKMHRGEIGHDQRAVFRGPFPGHPVMPGVLQVEAMAQVASMLMMRITQEREPASAIS